MRKFEIKKRLYKKLIKLSKKDKLKYNFLIKKINEIINSSNPEHYKNLSNTMKCSKRVHLGHFVLIFNYEKENDFIFFEDYDHHDKIYLK